MKEYEVMFIVKPQEELFDASISKYGNLIKTNEGHVDKVDRWGKKKLAYEIQDLFEGYYVLITFTSNHEGVKELDRVLKLDENVLRHMIIRKG